MMKFNLVKFSLTALAAFTLMACSSGGGGSSSPSNDSQAKPAQPSQPAKPSQPSKPSKPEQPSHPAQPSKPTQPSSNETGAVLSVDGEDDHISVKKVQLNSFDLKTINVDGRIIPISYGSGVSSGGWTAVKGKTVTINKVTYPLNAKVNVCCGKYTDVRFGAVESFEAGQSDIIFYNGNPSKNVPSTGVISYKGEAILGDHNDKIRDDYMRGTSSFKADFANKKLTGDLKISNKAANVDVTVNVDAKISGSSFSGTATSTSFAKQGISEGKFYGDNAKELGGLVKAEDNSWGGAFAAKK